MMDMPEIPQTLFGQGRVVAWFSCGVASTVAAKYAMDYYGRDNVTIAYCDTLTNEHPDNMRYLTDIESWLGKKIVRLHHPIYSNIHDVFRAVGYIKGTHGAPCTSKLKRDVRKAFQCDSDLHVFGFTVEEVGRREHFIDDNPSLRCAWPLIHYGATREHCMRMVRAAGIELPAMYRLGYRNNNCIGCVKGGAGYWNKVRVDFPAAFNRMAQLERQFGFALIRLKGSPVFLDELSPEAGKYEPLPDMSCGPQCVFQGEE